MMNANRAGKLLLLAALGAAGAGCQQSPLGVTSDRQVRHVVICWLKPDGDKQAILAAAKRLSELPGVVDYSAGYRIPSDREVVDDSFDIGLVFTLDSRDRLATFADAPLHRELMQTVLKPNLSKYVVYDATIERYDLGQATNEATRQRRAAAIESQRQVLDRRSK